MRVDFDEDGTVWAIQTSAVDAPLPGGVGVGSTERQISQALPTVRCDPHGDPARYSDWRVCTDTRRASGPFTKFTLIDGRVDHVTVARGLAD